MFISIMNSKLRFLIINPTWPKIPRSILHGNFVSTSTAVPPNDTKPNYNLGNLILFCFSLADLVYPSEILHLIDLDENAEIQVGRPAHFSCKEGHLMNASLDNELDGYDVSNLKSKINT